MDSVCSYKMELVNCILQTNHAMKKCSYFARESYRFWYYANKMLLQHQVLNVCVNGGKKSGLFKVN